MRIAALTVAGVLALAAGGVAGAAPAQEPPDPADPATAVMRQVCDLQWIDGFCEQFGYAEPQYLSAADPSPGLPLVPRVGAIHEHSGYSDGDPRMRPADYFAAAKTGHNVADDGTTDTGVILDYLMSSEHSENERLPITTAAVCIDPAAIPAALDAGDPTALPPILCSNVDQADHYRKWSETLAQAVAATDADFTAMRGFEWTNDYYNHLGVYFSRNVVNAKVDGSYLSMEIFWDWLRTPSTQGGGDDALVVFNHPGGNPSLSPFDGDLVINQALADTLGGGNWNDLALVPDVDDRVAGIEVNRGDDLSWYVKALRNGWHVGPIAAEDEHQREWASSDDGKTIMFTRGRSPRDHYFAFQHHRTIAVAADLVAGSPGTPAQVPTIWFWADAPDPQDPAAIPLGGAPTNGGPAPTPRRHLRPPRRVPGGHGDQHGRGTLRPRHRSHRRHRAGRARCIGPVRRRSVVVRGGVRCRRRGLRHR